MNENILWLCGLGFVPYLVSVRKNGRLVRTIEVRALFWQVTVRRQRGVYPWPSGRTAVLIEVPLIEKLRTAVWAAINTLING